VSLDLTVAIDELGADETASGGASIGRAPQFAPAALAEVSLAGLLVAVSDGYCALLRRPRKQLVGHSPLEFTHPDDQPETRAAFDRLARAADMDGPIEKRYVRGDGTTVWVRISGAWKPGRRGTICHATDITDLVAARDTAIAAERRLVALMEHSSDVVAVLDEDGRIVDANPATLRLVRHSRGAYLRDVVAELAHGQDRGSLMQWLGDIYAVPGLHPAVTFRLADGAGAWTYLEAIANNQLADPAIRGILLIAHDVTGKARQMQQVEGHKSALVRALARTTESRDPYTAGHQLKVADLSQRISERLGLPPAEIADIALGASLHDIGKISIPAEILTRPGRLSPVEFELVKSHSQVGHDILADAELPPAVTDIVLHHHERLDGSGYPHGLRGSEIGIAVHIVAVADVLDSVSSHRPYRPSKGMPAARHIIERDSGRLFEPTVVQAALAVTGNLEAGSSA
jgi:PAS domain S-box-containing protein/putative nucleotidyltransferase with HDIG domain